MLRPTNVYEDMLNYYFINVVNLLHFSVNFCGHLLLLYRAPDLCVPQPYRLIILALCFGSSHLHRQTLPRLQRRERTLKGKGETMGEKLPVILPTMATYTPL
jgi:hypothetical protein